MVPLSTKIDVEHSQIKPVRESMNEALQLWKKIAGKGDGSPDEQIASSHGRYWIKVPSVNIYIISIPSTITYFFNCSSTFRWRGL